MKAMKYLSALTAIVSGTAAAHGGHDHSSPMAFFEHLVWMAPIVIAVALAFYWFENRNQNKQD